MMSLFLTIFISISFAADNCNDLLQTSYIELEAARAENRSKLIKGEISQSHYENNQAILNDKLNQLERYGPAPDITAIQNIIHKTEPETVDTDSYHLKLLKAQSVGPYKLIDIDYDVESDNSLLTLGEGLSQKLSLANGSVVPGQFIDLPEKTIITLASFWPGEKFKAIVYREGESYLYDIENNNFDNMNIDFSAGIRFTHQFSYKGNYFYPSKYAKVSRLPVFSTMPPYRAHDIGDVLAYSSAPRAGNVYMSPREDYITIYNEEECHIYEMGLPEQQPPIRVNKVTSGFKIKACGVSADSKRLNLLTADGQLIVADMNKLKKNFLVNVANGNSPMYMSRTKISFNDRVLVGNAVISSDGRFLAFSTYESMDKALIPFTTVYDLERMEFIHEGVQANFFGNVMGIRFTSDSRHLIVNGDYKASIYGIKSAIQEVLK